MIFWATAPRQFAGNNRAGIARVPHACTTVVMRFPVLAPAQFFVAVIIGDMFTGYTKYGVIDALNRMLLGSLTIHFVVCSITWAVFAFGVIAVLALGFCAVGCLAIIGGHGRTVALFAAPFQQAPLDNSQHGREVVTSHSQHIEHDILYRTG